MKKKTRTKLVHEGAYVAKVEVELIESDEGWSPYLSVEDAYKLDDVREALRKGDLDSAMKFGKVFTLTPVPLARQPNSKPLRSEHGQSYRR